MLNPRETNNDGSAFGVDADAADAGNCEDTAEGEKVDVVDESKVDEEAEIAAYKH